MTEAFFFDTYAVIEIISGNPHYEKYRDAEIVLTKLNLFELFYSILKEDAGKARHYLKKYEELAIEFDSNVIQAAAAIKKSNRKLSMTDCIGYAVALKNGMKFLTGDREFEGMPNVEFMK
ncbi:MAG: PIN domain-containing protein [Candidatus Aenigmarchaeota archaeon]|nr:PIN domain-containing protein [Candidatus Aenigmarchaeota archaeon]